MNIDFKVRNYLEATIGKRATKNHALSHSTLVELQHGITLSTPHGLATHVNTNFFPHFIFTVFQIKYAISNEESVDSAVFERHDAINSQHIIPFQI